MSCSVCYVLFLIARPSRPDCALPYRTEELIERSSFVIPAMTRLSVTFLSTQCCGFFFECRDGESRSTSGCVVDFLECGSRRKVRQQTRCSPPGGCQSTSIDTVSPNTFAAPGDFSDTTEESEPTPPASMPRVVGVSCRVSCSKAMSHIRLMADTVDSLPVPVCRQSHEA